MTEAQITGMMQELASGELSDAQECDILQRLFNDKLSRQRALYCLHVADRLESIAMEFRMLAKRERPDDPQYNTKAAQADLMRRLRRQLEDGFAEDGQPQRQV